MFRIAINGHTVASESLASAGYGVSSPTLTQELNKADKLTFVIGTENPRYADLAPMSGTVTVSDGSYTVFVGRVVNTTKDFYNRKTVTCEGELAYLNDAVLRPYAFDGTVAEYYAMLLTAYNSAATADRMLTAGNVTVGGGRIIRENEDYTTVWSEMNELINSIGGYLKLRHTTSGGQQVTYLDYLASSGVEDTQIIAFGRNLIDLSNYIDGSELYTRIIPLGAADEDTGVKLTIKSVNDNKDYLADAAAEALYGRIERVVEWEDVTVAANLKTKAQAELAANIARTQTITISAIDLHMIDVNVSALKVGNMYRVVSIPHGLITQGTTNLFPLTKASVDIWNPANSRYTFGRTRPEISGG